MNAKEPERRSTNQNSRLWAMLTDLSKQLQWPVDGRMQWLDPADWKHVVSAGLKRHQRVAAGIDGGFVILGQHTSKMTKKDFAEMLEILFAFGAQHGIRWSDPSQPDDETLAEELARAA